MNDMTEMDVLLVFASLGVDRYDPGRDFDPKYIPLVESVKAKGLIEQAWTLSPAGHNAVKAYWEEQDLRHPSQD